VEIRDDRVNSRYELVVDGYMAELAYSVQGDRLSVDHTGVPAPIEGRGVAGRLMEAVVARARDEALTIVPQCSYARYWLEEHAEEVGGLSIAG
jgi:predicted GNAT family acetyltransferase